MACFRFSLCRASLVLIVREGSGPVFRCYNLVKHLLFPSPSLWNGLKSTHTNPRILKRVEVCLSPLLPHPHPMTHESSRLHAFYDGPCPLSRAGVAGKRSRPIFSGSPKRSFVGDEARGVSNVGTGLGLSWHVQNLGNRQVSRCTTARALFDLYFPPWPLPPTGEY
jgi:hypothetical protein